VFRTIADFERTWSRESEGTLTLLKGLDDRALSQTVADGHRTLGRVAWHLAGAIAEMMNRTGLAVEGPGEGTEVPKSAAEIHTVYERSARSLLVQIDERWNDLSLLVEDDMYGERWARGTTLMALVLHQTHHRGQMSVLMRQAGLRVSGIYGPALEEWGALGMAAPTI